MHLRMRAALLAIVLAAAAAAACGGRSPLGQEYEYEEDLTLSMDGSASLVVNASVPALDALKGMTLTFVSYGGIAQGLRAVEQLRLVLAELHAVTIRDTVSFHSTAGVFDSNGDPSDPASAVAAKTLIDQLLWWATALKSARAAQPYAG